MRVTSNRAFSRSDVSALIDRAVDEKGAVIIRRPGRKDLVLLSVDQLRELDTTAYLLASPKNRRRLLSALRDARAGKDY